MLDFSENGELGEELEVILELKLLVDVGLVGFFSVGKFILFLIVFKVKFKIGVYYFMIIKFNLGVVLIFDYRSFVMVDLLGLIEGVFDGVGFGY